MDRESQAMTREVVAVVDAAHYPTDGLQRLASRFEVRPIADRELAAVSRELREIQPHIMLCGIHLPVGEDMLGGCDRLRLVASPATGTTHLDLDYLGRRGIDVLTLRDCPGAVDQIFATAEHAWLLLLSLHRRLIDASGSVATGHFVRDGFLGDSVQGRTLGVVGLGRLGQRVASYGRAFGMKVIGVDPAPTSDDPVTPRVSLSELLPIADVLSIHVPLSESTRDMLGATRVRAMRKGAMLINTSRGEVLDEVAVASAVRSGHLGGVGVDVLRGESGPGFSPLTSPLVAAQRDGYNVVVTPHIGGWTRTAVGHTRTAMIDRLLQQ